MTQSHHTAWKRHLDTIADPLPGLSLACGVGPRDPGVVGRIIRKDETVCGARSAGGA